MPKNERRHDADNLRCMLARRRATQSYKTGESRLTSCRIKNDIIHRRNTSVFKPKTEQRRETDNLQCMLARRRANGVTERVNVQTCRAAKFGHNSPQKRRQNPCSEEHGAAGAGGLPRRTLARRAGRGQVAGRTGIYIGHTMSTIYRHAAKSVSERHGGGIRQAVVLVSTRTKEGDSSDTHKTTSTGHNRRKKEGQEQEGSMTQ
jgi:hypothetical protein